MCKFFKEIGENICDPPQESDAKGDYDGCQAGKSHTSRKLGFLLMSAFMNPVWGGWDWLFLLINWAKRNTLEDKTLLYSNEYE